MLSWVVITLSQTNLTPRVFSLPLVFCVVGCGGGCSAGELTQLCFERVWNQINVDAGRPW